MCLVSKEGKERKKETDKRNTHLKTSRSASSLKFVRDIGKKNCK